MVLYFTSDYPYIVLFCQRLLNFVLFFLFYILFSFFFFFFFFPAEDGIRDLYETGVQTCALPISSCGRSPRWCCRPGPPTRPPRPCSWSRWSSTGAATCSMGSSRGSATARPGSARCSTSSATRSEERRVGKECRWRWSACHEKDDE